MLPSGLTRLELQLGRDFGSEDLLLVQEELREDLARAMQTSVEQFTVAQVYGAGQFYLVDLPTGAVVQSLVAKAKDAGSSVFESRVLGTLDGITQPPAALVR